MTAATYRVKGLTLRALGLGSDPRRPSRALFSGIRRRLTVWYSAVIAVALVVSGLVLYLEVQQNLLGPVNGQLAQQAHTAALDWQQRWAYDATHPFAQFQGFNPCPVPEQDQNLDLNVLLACYNTSGRATGMWTLGIGLPQQGPASLGSSSRTSPFAKFLVPSLARSVAGGGSGSDTITTSNSGEYASIQRYAQYVPKPAGFGKGAIGIVQVGLPVGGQGQALSTLLSLLLGLGVLTVLFSIGAGLFLASRALQPARIAYARQRDFIADASHELRTPLTMLRSTVEFVLRGKEHLSSDDVALLEDTVAETTHLTQLANNMLDLARLDSDNFHIEEEVVDLGDVASEIGRWSRALARERGVTVTVHVSEPLLVLGDGSLLEQSILVLVDNGIKYNHPGGTVEISVRRVGSDGVVEVKDTGIGVSPEHLKRLGERFYRVDKARSRESGGAGLGLSIVRSVIARHNGDFGLESEPGTGTTATIRLSLISEHDMTIDNSEPSPETEPVSRAVS